jgi:hypothetical protein
MVPASRARDRLTPPLTLLFHSAAIRDWSETLTFTT